jgi:hypothetical protein
MGILISGSPVPHKHPRRAPLGDLGWAWWPEGRLVALQSHAEGRFSLWPLSVSGRTVRVNFRAAPAGYLQVEAAGAAGTLPGRAFEDCDYLSGDDLDGTVSWRGQTDIGHQDGEPVTLRFRLRSADLFSVRFA